MFDGPLNVAQRLRGLGIRIASTNDPAVGARGRGTRNEYGVADANGARVTDERLPRRAGGECLTPHVILNREV